MPSLEILQVFDRGLWYSYSIQAGHAIGKSRRFSEQPGRDVPFALNKRRLEDGHQCKCQQGNRTDVR